MMMAPGRCGGITIEGGGVGGVGGGMVRGGRKWSIPGPWNLPRFSGVANGDIANGDAANGDAPNYGVNANG